MGLLIVSRRLNAFDLIFFTFNRLRLNHTRWVLTEFSLHLHEKEFMHPNGDVKRRVYTNLFKVKLFKNRIQFIKVRTPKVNK